MLKRTLSLLLALQLLTAPAFAGGSQSTVNLNQVNGAAIALGQNTGAASLPVSQSAPLTVTSNTATRQANATPYGAGTLFGTSATAASNTVFSWAIAPGNGVPVSAIKAIMMTQTSGNAGVTLTNGSFRLHLYGQSPTIASIDGASISTTLASWCGTLDGTLINLGTDWSIAEMVPTFGWSVMCSPAGGSSTIYGLLEARAAFTPTSGEITQVKLMVQ